MIVLVANNWSNGYIHCIKDNKVTTIVEPVKFSIRVGQLTFL